MKSVKFSDTIVTFETHSASEYDRFPIHSILYQKAYNEINDMEWKHVLKNLKIFKQSIMPVHIDSILGI